MLLDYAAKKIKQPITCITPATTARLPLVATASTAQATPIHKEALNR